jgi:chemotaxis protein MotA
MNKASVIGLFLGMAAIIGGNTLEGGRINSIVQGSAALIVFGGTIGATFLSFSIKDIMLASRLLKRVFYDDRQLPEPYSVIRNIVDFATKARRKGILSLDSEMKRINYGFFKRALRLAIDGIDPKILQNTLEQENRTFEEEIGRAAKVFEAAGGYAPTIGIIGAVLGLIHVMENLSDPTKLGSGIAVAFVATVYGVASANLIFLPIAKKMINNMKQEIFIREIIIEGILGIQAGKNPFYLKEHLSSFLLRSE